MASAAAAAALRRTATTRLLNPSTTTQCTTSLCTKISSLSLGDQITSTHPASSTNNGSNMTMSTFIRRDNNRRGGDRGGGGSSIVPRQSNPRLRTHAVSIVHGNYNDYEDYDDDETYEEAFPLLPEDAATTDGGEEDDILHFEEDESELDREAREALAEQRLLDAKRLKWMENAKPPKRIQQIDARGRAYGRGSRKTSSARVWIEPGTGLVSINQREMIDYFRDPKDREDVCKPFIATETCGKFDVYAVVQGGGTSGQAGAIRLGVARALQNYNPEYRPPMKRLGFMTRDPRKVERKKVGLKKARKAPQWVRR